MKTVGLLKSFSAAVAVCSLPFSVSTASAASVDLTPWVAESYDSVSGFGDGVWTTDGAGATVLQSVNGQPTVFYSDFDAQGLAATGTINVSSAGGDDDYIGFVLGFDAGDSSSSDADYLLVSWKGVNQSYDFGQPDDGPSTLAAVGLSVSRVTGVPLANEFWGLTDYSPNNSGAVEELQRATTLGSTGWGFNTDYNFSFDFGPNNLVVSVNGEKELDIAGTFEDGKFGFYNFSQAQVTYSAFEVEDGTFPTVPLPAGLPLLLVGLGAFGIAGRRKRKAA